MKMTGRNIELIHENCLDGIVGGRTAGWGGTPSGLGISLPNVFVNLPLRLAPALDTIKLSVTTVTNAAGDYMQKISLTIKFRGAGGGGAVYS